MLLTRSRLCPGASPGSSLHLHVLSTPPAFVLSQDQTLREELLSRMSLSVRHTRDRPYTWAGSGRIDGVLLAFWPVAGQTATRAGRRQGRTWTHTQSAGMEADRCACC